MTDRRIFISWREPALLAVAAAILAIQLFVPPFIGLADNGDFAKIAGRLSLGPRGGPAKFIYFVPDYVRSPRYYWNSLTLSTELPLAWLATRLRNGDAFDIRWLGAVHGVVFLCALYALIRCLRPLAPWRGFLIAAVAIFLFTDVNYVAYFNSFFTDAAALLGLLLTAALAIHMAMNGIGNWNTILFSLAALLFIGSKPQHALWGFLPAAFLAMAGRKRGLAAAFLLLAVSAFTIWASPPGYTAPPLFTLVFSKLARANPAVLTELGLPPSDAKYIGMHAFMEEAPVLDPKWLAGFTRQINYHVVLRWYVHHPARTLEFLNETLALSAFQMRAQNLSNFRQKDGHPAGARTRRFALWSDFRSALFLKWPHHMLAWYLLVIAGSIRIVRTRPTPSLATLGWITLGIAALGIGEFCVASLADAAETHRHLFLFHASTDLTVCLAFSCTLSTCRRNDGRSS